MGGKVFIVSLGGKPLLYIQEISLVLDSCLRQGFSTRKLPLQERPRETRNIALVESSRRAGFRKASNRYISTTCMMVLSADFLMVFSVLQASFLSALARSVVKASFAKDCMRSWSFLAAANASRGIVIIRTAWSKVVADADQRKQFSAQLSPTR